MSDSAQLYFAFVLIGFMALALAWSIVFLFLYIRRAHEGTKEDEESLTGLKDKLGQGDLRIREGVLAQRKRCIAASVLEKREGVDRAISQRLQMLDEALASDKEPEKEVLISFIEGLSGELNRVLQANPVKNLSILQHVYEEAGILVETKGDLPGDPEKAAVFVGIAIEALENAVLHGLADRVTLHFSTSKTGGLKMFVTDNGTLPPGAPKPGKGIRAMQEMASQVGGSLKIRSKGQFIVEAELPE